jgi:hypothetical protein
MDEIEYRVVYNDAVTSAEKITARETKEAVMLILQLIDGLNARITELQEAEEDC